MRTAAAETSFINLAFSWISGLTISVKASRLVLISSRIRTKPIVKVKMLSSKALKPKISAVEMTKMVIIKWILRFGSVFKAVFKPLNAKEKLLKVGCLRLIVIVLSISLQRASVLVKKC